MACLHAQGSAVLSPSPVCRRFFSPFHYFANFSTQWSLVPGYGLRIPDSLSKKNSRNPDSLTYTWASDRLS